MGLDLICGNEYGRVGSYSTVHVQRIGWIRAALAWMERNDALPYELQEKMSSLIKKETSALGSRESIRYPLFEELSAHFPSGVVAFVNHSDCDGSWSPDECQEMLEFLDLASRDLSATQECKNYFDEIEDGRTEYYLAYLFRHSVDTDQPIEFC